MSAALRWLDRNWPFAGTVSAAFLLCLVPLLVGSWPTAVNVLGLLAAVLSHLVIVVIVSGRTQAIGGGVA